MVRLHPARRLCIIQERKALTRTGTTREWAVLSVVPFVLLLIIVATNSVWMPTWTYFVALGFGASAMLPMSLVYAISGFSMEVGIFNELVYGCESGRAILRTVGTS